MWEVLSQKKMETEDEREDTAYLRIQRLDRSQQRAASGKTGRSWRGRKNFRKNKLLRNNEDVGGLKNGISAVVRTGLNGSPVWWLRPGISAYRKMRQTECQFKDSLNIKSHPRLHSKLSDR